MNRFILMLVVSLALSASIVRATTEDDDEKDEDKENIKYVVTHEVYLDVAIKDTKEGHTEREGRIVIGLFGDVAPMTSTNFAQIAKGFKRDNKKFSYKSSSFHRVVKDFVIQGGDIVAHDGTGSKSIYGEKFIDENFLLSHRSAGWVSMANYGPDTNGSQFFITLVPARWLDGHHVVFGKVLSGMDLIREIGELKVYKGTTSPKKYVEITDSGSLDIHKYELTEDQLDSSVDIK